MARKFARMSVAVWFARNDGLAEQWVEFIDNDPMNMQLKPEWLDDEGVMGVDQWQLVRALHDLKQALISAPEWKREFEDAT